MNPLKEPSIHRIPESDVEKRGELDDATVDITLSGSALSENHDITSTPQPFQGRLARWNDIVEGLAGLEARGITRVLPEEKHAYGPVGYLQMSALWFGINLCVQNGLIGLLGPLVFSLGWTDCICIVVFANALSCCGPAYTATFGPRSGNRTMILGRYFMGYWPSKITCILNIVVQIGWGVIGSIVAGQIFSAVNGHGMSMEVGCVVAALCIGLLAIFGIGIIHTHERYAWIPQLIAFFVLIGCAGPHFNTALKSVGPAGTITANRCSFFAIEYSAVIGWSGVGADFYVYYPINTDRRLTFFMTWLGLWLAVIFTSIVGVGIGSGVATTPAWSDAYNVSTGALLLACYDGLGGFGGLLVVILALGGVANNAPGTYAASLSCQVLGRYTKAIPRWFWSTVIMIIELVCAVAGRNHLFNVFEDFLPIVSYWISPWMIIVLEEHLIFHVLRGVPFDWSVWEDKRKLPVGIAALFAWLCGWAGAIIGMDQAWYQGPIGVNIGGYGGDIGAWMAIAFACVVYPPLRFLEMKKFGR